MKRKIDSFLKTLEAIYIIIFTILSCGMLKVIMEQL